MLWVCTSTYKQGEKGQTDTRRRVVPICVYIYSPRPTGWQRRKRIQQQHRLDDDGTSTGVYRRRAHSHNHSVGHDAFHRSPVLICHCNASSDFRILSRQTQSCFDFCHRFFSFGREGFVSFGYSQLPANLFIAPVCSLLLRKFHIFLLVSNFERCKFLWAGALRSIFPDLIQLKTEFKMSVIYLSRLPTLLCICERIWTGVRKPRAASKFGAIFFIETFAPRKSKVPPPTHPRSKTRPSLLLMHVTFQMIPRAKHPSLYVPTRVQPRRLPFKAASPWIISSKSLLPWENRICLDITFYLMMSPISNISHGDS